MAKIECSNRLRVILAEKELTNRWLAEQMVEIAQLLKVDIKDLIEADFNYDIE